MPAVSERRINHSRRCIAKGKVRYNTPRQVSSFLPSRNAPAVAHCICICICTNSLSSFPLHLFPLSLVYYPSPSLKPNKIKYACSRYTLSSPFCLCPTTPLFVLPPFVLPLFSCDFVSRRRSFAVLSNNATASDAFGRVSTLSLCAANVKSYSQGVRGAICPQQLCFVVDSSSCRSGRGTCASAPGRRRSVRCGT